MGADQDPESCKLIGFQRWYRAGHAGHGDALPRDVARWWEWELKLADFSGMPSPPPTY